MGIPAQQRRHMRRSLAALYAYIDSLPGGTTGSGEVNTPISTVGNGTLSAAGLVGALITRTGSTGAFSDASDTVANVVAALPADVTFPTSWEFSVINNTGFQETITAGSGFTISGVQNVGPSSVGRFLLTLTSKTAGTILGMWNDAQDTFGGGTATFPGEGNISRQVSGAGINPATTGNDNVLAVFSLPAGSFDIAGRGLTITAAGSCPEAINTKDIKIIFGATTAVVGSAVTGGVAIADSGAFTAGTGGWQISASVFKYGAAGSNTQLGLHTAFQVKSTLGPLLTPVALTATESGAILIAVTGNATTAVANIVFNWLEINAMN